MAKDDERNKNIILNAFFLFCLLLIAATVYYLFSYQNSNVSSNRVHNYKNSTSIENQYSNTTNLYIAAWNLHFFSESKAENETLLLNYSNIMKKYDIILAQEIIDSNGSIFSKLCNYMQGYDCILSTQAGRTRYKERYGVIYNKSKIKISSFIDMNPDPLNRWERPPLVLNLTAVNKIKDNKTDNAQWIIIYLIHTKPSDTTAEISNLEKMIGNPDFPVIIIGDLNADCSFYNTSNKGFKEWNWIIKDEDDTTVGKSDCAYDRIIINNVGIKYYSTYGIYKDISNDLSDHYLIWLKISI